MLMSGVSSSRRDLGTIFSYTIEPTITEMMLSGLRAYISLVLANQFLERVHTLVGKASSSFGLGVRVSRF